jgi:hypothetical protein
MANQQISLNKMVIGRAQCSKIFERDLFGQSNYVKDPDITVEQYVKANNGTILTIFYALKSEKESKNVKKILLQKLWQATWDVSKTIKAHNFNVPFFIKNIYMGTRNETIILKISGEALAYQRISKGIDHPKVKKHCPRD